MRQTLAITESLPEEARRQQLREISDEVVATLGASMAVVRPGNAGRTGRATRVLLWDVRLGLRRLADYLEPAGIQVLEDCNQVQLVRKGASMAPSPTCSSPTSCRG